MRGPATAYLASVIGLLPGNISHLLLLVTARCNHRCDYCFYWKGQGPLTLRDELTVAEYERLAEQVGRVLCLTVSGGEPTLRDDIAQIITAFHRRAGVRTVQLHSNGFLTDRLVATVRELVERHKDLALDVCLSIDGLGADHDQVRQVPRSFDRLMATVERLSALRACHPGLGLELNTTFSATTAPRIRSIARFVRDTLGLNYNLALVRGGPRDPAALDVDLAEYRAVCREVGCYREKSSADNYPFASFVEAIRQLVPGLSVEALRRGRQVVPCQAGRRLLVIDERGEVWPCEVLGRSFGNLRSADFRLGDLMARPESRALVRSIARGGCHCSWECAIPVSLIFSARGLARIGRTRLQWRGR